MIGKLLSLRKRVKQIPFVYLLAFYLLVTFLVGMWNKAKKVYIKHAQALITKELEKITDFDEKIKYISEHKIINEKTKVDIVKKFKEYNEKRERDLKLLNCILQSSVSEKSKKFCIEQYKEGEKKSIWGLNAPPEVGSDAWWKERGL